MAFFCDAIRRNSLSLLRFPFLSHVPVFSSEISLVCRFRYPYSSFFFPPICLLVIFVLLIIVLFVLFLVAAILVFLGSFFFMNSMKRRIDAILNVGESSSSNFSRHVLCPCHLLDVWPYTSSLVFLFYGPLVEVLPPSKRDSQNAYPF